MERGLPISPTLQAVKHLTKLGAVTSVFTTSVDAEHQVVMAELWLQRV